MRCIKNEKLIDFLWLNGVKPVYENAGNYYYYKTDKLRELMNSYYIRNVCFKNKGW